jgi:hypothetical protein
MAPNMADAAVARLSQGTKVYAEGGHDRVFYQTFGAMPGEQLRKAYACYLSTSSGPVIGTLYLSTARLAFCSDSPLCYQGPAGQQQECMYYKVSGSLPFTRLQKFRSSFPYPQLLQFHANPRLTEQKMVPCAKFPCRWCFP